MMIPTTEQAKASQCPKGINLCVWPKLQELRAMLGQKAKQEKRYRFYSLYGHICRKDTLAAAWSVVRSNAGACGIDGVTIDQIDVSPESVSAFLADIEQSLREKTYQSQAVQRVYIEKDGGKLRPLGIPTVRDRVVQCAVKLILEPIYEEDFLDCSYGYRPGRKAHDALDEVRANLKAGRTAVYDADLAGYFDSIPHDKLRKGLEVRIADRSVLSLIELWLTAVIVEPPVRDRQGRSIGGAKMKRATAGTPQGGVLSPLLANLHLHWFDRAFRGKDGPGRWANARLVRFADDFVVMARFIDNRIIEWTEYTIEGRLGLEINREKTRVIKDLREDSERLDFLGISFRYDVDLYGRETKYLNIGPSPKSMTRERQKLTEMTNSSQCFTPVKELIERINRQVGGWFEYFKYGYPKKAFGDINHHIDYRLSKHLKRRSQRGYKMPEDTPSKYAYIRKLGFKPL